MSSLSRKYSLAAAAALAGVLSVYGASSAQAAPLAPGVDADFGTNGRVRAFLASGDNIYLAGSFTKVFDGAGAHDASNVALYNKSTKRYVQGFNASTNGVVTSLAQIGGRLYLGGEFSKVNGSSRGHIAAINASSGGLDGGFHADANAGVDALLVGNGGLYASGSFKTINSGGSFARSFVARLDPGSGRPDGWSANPNGRVRTLGLSNNGSAVFLAGSFSAVDGMGSQNKVSKVSSATGGVVGGFVAGNTSTNGHQPVMALAVGSNDRLLLGVGGAGGACTSMNGTSGSQAWTHRNDGDAQAVELIGGTAWCGGHFEKTGGVTRTKLAAFNADSGALNGFNIDLNSNLGVWALGQTGTTLLVGGDFTKANQAAVDHVITVN